MTDVEEDMLKNLIILLAKKIEKLNDSINSLNLALKWFDKTAKEIYDSNKTVKNLLEKHGEQL